MNQQFGEPGIPGEIESYVVGKKVAHLRLSEGAVDTFLQLEFDDGSEIELIYRSLGGAFPISVEWSVFDSDGTRLARGKHQ
jgi:hypothetical protein